MKFTRVTVNLNQMGGVPCIRGLRIPVATVVGLFADGFSAAEILAAYPDLTGDDIQEALRFAAETVRERTLPLTNSRGCEHSALRNRAVGADALRRHVLVVLRLRTEGTQRECRRLPYIQEVAAPARVVMVVHQRGVIRRTLVEKSKAVVPTEADRIKAAILVVRGQRVILDADLAALYGVTTKRLNEQVKRNSDRFPQDFLFRFSRTEAAASNRSQIATGCQKHRDPRFRRSPSPSMAPSWPRRS